MHSEELEILRRIEIARGCMKSLSKNIWCSSITQSVKIGYNSCSNTYVLPVLLYGSEMWHVTVKSGKRLDVFDQWCLRHILQVPFTVHVTNSDGASYGTKGLKLPQCLLQPLQNFCVK